MGHQLQLILIVFKDVHYQNDGYLSGYPVFSVEPFLCFFDLQFPQEHLFDHKKQLQKNQAPSKLELLFYGMSTHKSQVFLRVNTAPGF